MPKSIEIEEFSTKLGLVAKRLNWSGAKLAQQAGVDKSAAARWLNARSRPTDHSVMQLTKAIVQSIPGFTKSDWDLPLDQFGARLGLDGAALARSPGARGPAQLRLEGLRFSPVTEFGEPYLGLWCGFYQSATNGGRPRLGAGRFFINDLGLRFSFTEGDFSGEGPVLASRSHLQCLIDIGPLHDRLAFFICNGVQAPRALAIDGIVTVMAGDSTATPIASTMFFLRIDLDMALDAVEVGSLSSAVMQVNERAREVHEKTGNPLAVMSELVPLDILRTLYPVVGAAHADGQIDHLLRSPVARSLASGSTGDATRRINQALLSEISAKERRALGIERTRPQLRVLGPSDD